jgi:hypothetical protein
MSTDTHSQRAVAAALAAMQPCHERTAIVVLANGIALEAVRLLGAKRAAELAYNIADGLAVLVEPK